MNNLQFVELVSMECKKKGVKKSELLTYCNVNHGYLSDLVKKNNAPSIEIVLKMAEFFNCSVDYLLGRTDTPNATINVNGNGNHHNVQANDNSTINIGKSENDGLKQEFIEMFDELSRDDKIEVLGYMKNLKKNKG